MARKAPLPPGASVTRDSAGGVRFYRARIGARLSAAGVLRKAFPTRAEAEAWIREQTKPAVKIQTSGLTAEQLEDARGALEILGGRARLCEVASEWLRRRKGETTTVGDAISLLEAEHRAVGLSERHRKQTKAKLLRFFSDLTKRNVADIVAEDIERARDALDAWGRKPSAAQKVTRLRHAAILFNLALERGWIEHSPLRGVARPRLHSKQVEILTPHQAAALMFHAMEIAPDIVVPLAIKLFAGLRNKELYDLDWGSIDEGIRIVRSKTGKPRTVAVSENLKAWLGDRPKAGRVWDRKPKVKDREAVWLEALAPIAAAAGFKIPQNALRHSFGTYYRQRCKSDHETAFQMGNSPAVVQRHYADAVSDKATSLYWLISPFTCEAVKDEPMDVEGPDEESPEPEPLAADLR